MKWYSIILLFFTIGNSGCRYFGQSIILDNAEKMINNQELIDTSSVKYIHLETNSQCLIGRVTQLKITKNNIFVVNSVPNVLYRFDKDGNFVCKIGEKGRGPAEYLTIGNIDVNEDKQEVILYDSDLCQALIYSYNGKFLYSFKNKYEPYGEIIRLNDSLYALENYFNNTGIPSNPEILILDDKGEIVKTYIERPLLINKKCILPISANTSFFSKSTDHNYYIPLGTDKLYELSSDHATNILVYDFKLSSQMLPVDITKNDLKTKKKLKYGPIQGLNITDEGIFYGSVNFNDRPIHFIGNFDEGIKIVGQFYADKGDKPGLILPLTTYKDCFVGMKNRLQVEHLNKNEEGVNPSIVFYKYRMK